MIRTLATGAIAAYAVWLDEDGLDQMIVGGTLLCLIATNIVVLNEVLTDAQSRGLVIDYGVFGEISVFSVLAFMIFFYILRPVRVFYLARARREEIAERVEQEVQS
jgi:large-conductance mechanosensitive channel